MRNLLFILATVLVSITSCSTNTSTKDVHGDYVGTFLTDQGIKFVLNPDSTATIYFSDTLTYNATWKPVKSSDNWQYANIEFAGYLRYYFLHDGKLYRSEREMRNDFNGEKVIYSKD